MTHKLNESKKWFFNDGKDLWNHFVVVLFVRNPSGIPAFVVGEEQDALRGSAAAAGRQPELAIGAIPHHGVTGDGDSWIQMFQGIQQVVKKQHLV